MLPFHHYHFLNLQGRLESIGIPFTVAAYKPGAVIFGQGDACDTVMHIEEGRVRLAVTTRTGREMSPGLLEAGEFLGEETLVGRKVRNETAIAMADTELLVIAGAEMRRLLRAQPALRDRFIVGLVERHARFEADLIDQLLHTAEERLARTLVVLAGGDPIHPGRRVLPHVPQEVIAQMVGTTRSRVNLFLGKFRKLGLIEEAGGVLEVKPALLSAVHDRR